MLFSRRSAGEHVVIAGHTRSNRLDGIITVELYTVDGTFVRRILLRGQGLGYFNPITVTMEGHIAVRFFKKVVVFKN